VSKVPDATLQQATKKQLQAELRRREREEVEEANEDLRHRHQLIVTHVDVLLEFAATHSSSCSDEQPLRVNDPMRCRRCRLLEIQKDEANYSDTVVDITLREEATRPPPPELPYA